MHTDPLLSYEKNIKHRSIFRSFGRTARFLITYFAITGCVFVCLLSLLNFSAYSNRVLNFINPEALISAREKVEGILASSSIEVHASESEESEKMNSLESVTEKILDSSPEIVYKDSYTPRELLA